MGDFDKSCGFICGKEDLANWNPLEIHHLVNGTKDYYGVLKDLVPNYTEGDIRNFIKLSPGLVGGHCISLSINQKGSSSELPF